MADTVVVVQREVAWNGFLSFDCDSLKRYLRERGISTTGYKKESVVQSATCACDIAVHIDPEETARDIFGQVRKNREQFNFRVSVRYPFRSGSRLRGKRPIGRTFASRI